jgi:putative PEP-CTERM system TPR-repeat lipoprotein
MVNSATGRLLAGALQEIRMVRKGTLGRCVVALVCVLAAGCHSDPEARKREYLAQGDNYLKHKKYPEAILAYRKAIEQDERFGEARRGLAKAYAGVGDLKDSVDQLVRAADLLPNDVTLQLDAVNGLLSVRRFADARARADAVLAANPNNVDARIMRATAIAGLGDFDTAVSEIRRAIDIEPRRTRSYVDLGALFLLRARYTEAEAAFKQAIALDPRSVDAHLALATLYRNTNRQPDAEQYLKKALDIDPESVAANRMLADLYLTSGRAAAAEAPLRKASAKADDVSSRMELADYYIRQNRPNDARPVLEEVARDPRGYAVATTRLAGLEYAAGHIKEAHALVDAVLAKQPDNPIALVSKGRWLLIEQKLDDALAAAQAAAKADPQYAEAHFLLGQVYSARKEPEKALASFLEVLRLNPNAVEAEKAAALLQLQAGRRDVGLQFAEQAVKARPDDVNARLLLVRAMLANGQIDRAQAELQGMVPAASDRAETHVLLGRVQQAKKDPAAARRSFEHALELNPRAIEALQALVSLDVEDKQPDQARRRVEAALSKTPDSAPLLMLAARTYASTGDLDRAENSLKRALQVDPSLLEAYGALGELYVRQHKLDQARAEFERLAAKRPDDITANTMVGMILQAQGKSADAAQAYETIVGRNPKAAVASNNLAYILAEQNASLDRALNLAQAAKAELPDNPDVNDTLGWIYYKKGLASLAIDPLEQSARTDPSNAIYQYHLGFAYLKAGDKRKGRAALERALKLKPDSEMAAEARKALS